MVSSDFDGDTIMLTSTVRQSPMATSIDLKADRQTMLLLGLVSDDFEGEVHFKSTDNW